MTALDGVVGRMTDIVAASVEMLLNVADRVDRLVDDVREDAHSVARDAESLADVVAGAGQRLQHAWHAAPRFARVVAECSRLLALHRLQDARARVLGDAAVENARARLHRHTARRLHDLCIELRGGVLKLGQFASSRIDLLPQVYVESLARLQDRVPSVDIEAILMRIESELGPITDRFAFFDREPIAAASLAQVHAATLEDGSRVVVKVQVPGVEDDVLADLAALRVIAPLAGEIVPGVDVETIATELSRSVEAELDYEREAESAEAFARCFEGDPEIIVPRVHRELCGGRVLVLERIDGVRIVDWLNACEERGEAGARDRDRLLGILLRGFCDQVLVHGLVHTDPHPGNFLVVEGEGGPRLAILDFGSVQHYDRARRRAWAELALAVVMRDETKLTGLFEALGFEPRDGDDSLRVFADLLLEHFRPDAALALDFDPRERIAKVLDLMRENPVVRIPADFVQLARIFTAAGGLLLRYRPAIDLFATLTPRLTHALTE